ncbi:MAG TPA: methyltransferase domain-containing protein [Candidatus Cryosericum sp.]|nr:methyltransferase domain-containing protein [Candidatus Cryosericum sp.]
MDFETLMAIQDEAERTAATYEIFNEESRLNRSKAARVEFITNARAIESALFPGARILDIGAGAGEYSLYFAKQGCDVTAVELAPANMEAFRAKITPESPLTLIQGNALNLSMFADGSFDVVLLMGPLYHLRQAADRNRAIAEAKRVCKKGGTIFFAFISNDMVVLTELSYRPGFFSENTYDHESFKVEDFPFVFFTLEQMREMLRENGIAITREIASDGVSELMEDAINALDEQDYAQYMRYHLYCSEKPEMLGRSNHLLFAGKAVASGE